MPNEMPGTGLFVQTNMSVPAVGLNQGPNWRGSSMEPLTVVPLLAGQAFSARGVGVQSLTVEASQGPRLNGKQGTLELLIQLGSVVVAAAATGSIAVIAGSRLVDEAATGSITAVAGADLVDGQTFTLNDGVNPAKVFEFDSNASVAGGHVAVTFTAADSASTVRDAIITAINGAASLAITASIGGTDKVILVNDKGGAFGNQTITESVIDNGFVVSGMSGGGQTFTLNDGVNPPTTFEFDSDGTVTSGSVAVTFTAGDSVTTVRDAIIAAINGVGAGLAITASIGGSNIVTLTNDADGSFGNQSIQETVADAGFIVTGMAQGATATSIRTVCYLTDDPTNPQHFLAVRVDASNRPSLEITDSSGTTVAEVTPSYGAIAAGQQVAVHLAWDSQNVVSAGRYATFKVNREAVPAGDWNIDPTSSWTAFQPTHLVLGASLGDADFDGTIASVQLSNIVTP